MRFFVFLLALTFALCCTITPIAYAAQNSGGHFPVWRLGIPFEMHLPDDATGWVITRDDQTMRLLITNNDSSAWKDITPLTPAHEQIYSVFFLNDKTGWLLGATPDSHGNESIFNVESTQDGGRIWSMISLPTIPGIAEEHVTMGPGGHIAFVDSQHGLMNLDIASGSNFSFGWLLATFDGGRTWRHVPGSPGIGGVPSFTTPTLVWLAGGPADADLYVTRDGLHTWSKVSLPPPPSVLPATLATYSLPSFTDKTHGFLSVTYTGGPEVASSVVLFGTTDGGLNWTPDRILSGLNYTSFGQHTVSAIADSMWLIAKSTEDETPALTAIDLSKSTPSDTYSQYFDARGIAQALSFVSARHGWGLVSSRLFSTTDGGSSWVAITPGARDQSDGSDVRRAAVLVAQLGRR